MDVAHILSGSPGAHPFPCTVVAPLPSAGIWAEAGKGTGDQGAVLCSGQCLALAAGSFVGLSRLPGTRQCVTAGVWGAGGHSPYGAQEFRKERQEGGVPTSPGTP